MRPRLALASSIVAAAFAAAAAQQPSPGPRFERAVRTDGSGPRKLPVDLALVTGGQRFSRVAADAEHPEAAGGLADLRLFDASGRELPYLLVMPPRPRPAWTTGSVLPIAPTDKTSGFEVDLGAVRDVDALAVDGLRPPFLKRFTLEGSGDRIRWTTLLEQGTLFDLPDERVRHTAIGFDEGSYRYLRLTWDDTNSARLSLPGGARARHPTRVPDAPALRATVPLQRQSSEPGLSRYGIRLPGSGLPVVALLINPGTADVFRPATVMETRFRGSRAEPAELGRGRLVRAERPGSPRPLRIAIEPPQTPELQLVVEDGNNPPLALESVDVEFARLPWIYVEAPGGPLIARYGDPTAQAPQYDLEARRASVSLDGIAEAAWGEPRRLAPRDTADAAPPPAVPGPGAKLDTAGFQYRRRLPEGSRELVAVQLDAAVLSRSRGPLANFADVRIVDGEGRQVPYLVERRAEPLSLDVALTPKAPQVRALRENTEGSRSTYAVALPYPNLPGIKLVLETSDRVFRRVVQVGVERPPDRRRREPWFDILAAPVWQHADQATAAPGLEIPIRPREATDLLVVVEEGDNRPLALVSSRVLLPSWRLRFFRESNPLDLLYGKPDLGPPEYDLALLAPAVMSGAAEEIAAAPEAAQAPRPVTEVLPPSVFWIGLSIAVLVLLGLIVRLIAAGTPPPPPPGP